MYFKYFDSQHTTLEETCVTIGVFDGIHRGHTALLDATVNLSRQNGLKSICVTFDPHPLSLLKPDISPKLIYPLEKRCELIKDCGIDEVLVIKFDTVMARQSAQSFISNLLVDSLNVKAVVVGEDFKFGHNREGNLELLTQWGEKLGFKVLGLPLITDVIKNRISSTKLRTLILNGKVSLASELMGRYYSYKGKVVHGNKMGEKLGFPTANIFVNEGLVLPKNGIYAGYCNINNKKYVTAFSIGSRPTIDDVETVSFEAYIVDFDNNIYGIDLEVFLIDRLRDEIKFDSLEELVNQIKKDVEQTVQIVSKLNIWL